MIDVLPTESDASLLKPLALDKIKYYVDDENNSPVNQSFETPRIGTLSRSISLQSLQSLDNLPQSYTHRSVPVYPDEYQAQEDIFHKVTSNKHFHSAFYVNDTGIVERQHQRWVHNLPTVQPYYAVKCNPDEILLRVLADLNTGFDCASAEEISQVLDIGVSPDRIIFANPVKSILDIKFAAECGVKRMTFDNEDELVKIHEFFPEAECVLRLLADDSGSIMRFGSKFGAPLETVESMLLIAKDNNIKVVGTSFHIGSGCFDANTYRSACSLSRQVYDMAIKLGLPAFTLLDIGGGFPGHPVAHVRSGKTPSFEEFAAVIREAIAENYPPESTPSQFQVIAEPGRYMATSWSTLYTFVQGKRLVPNVGDSPRKNKKFLYYLNDGVYGSFNCIMFDHAHPMPYAANKFFSRNKLKLSPSSLFSKNMNLTARSQNNSPRDHSSDSTSSSSLSPSPLSPSSSKADQSELATEGASSTSGLSSYGTFFGPTCDSMDCIVTDYQIDELNLGDWVAFTCMGAYTNAAASTFNGMPKPVKHYCKSQASSQYINEINEKLNALMPQ